MDIATLSKARRLIYNAIAGLDGPIAGKNCKIQSVEDITGGHRITFSWNDDEGVARTSTVDVMDGNSIEEVEVKYASSQSGTTPPPSGSWSDDVPSVPDGYYLWTRNTVTFSNGDTKIEYLVGRQGVNGVSPTVTVTDISGGHKVRITDKDGNHDFNVMDGLAIDFIDVDYAESSSGTSAPLVGWQSNPPEVATGNYLWTRNTTHLMDGTTSVAYMVGLQGAAGVSPDVETTPVSGGTQVVITDKDGPHSFTVLNGIDGADGQDGAAGADGFSPIITTDKVGKTTTITIVDAAGTKYATVLDGVDGKTITNITINSQNHVIVTYSDGTTSDAGELIVQSAVMSVNGQTGDVELELPDVVNVGANLTYDPQTNTLSADAQSIDVDSEISSTSENPVQNKVIKSALDDKVDKVSGKGLSTNDYTTAEKDKLSGIASGAEVNVQSDWNQTDTTADDYIKNKPDIPAMQLQSDWNQTDTTAKDYIKNKPTLGTAAAKDSTNSVTENSTDLVESGAVKTAIDSAISRVYKPAGNKTCAQLTSELLVKANLGNVYNMTDSGTTTSDFVEGAGKTIELGDNVAVVDVGTSQSPSYKFDLLSGMVDLTNYIQKSSTAGLIKNDGTVDTTEYNGKITVSNDTSALTDSDSFDETSAGTNPTSTKRRLLTSLWTYIKSKITGGISGIVDSNLTTNRALISNSSGKVAVSSVTNTELGYLSGVSSNIQNQFDSMTGSLDSDYPIDPILHYSFDEVPDTPDGTYIYKPAFVDNTEAWNHNSGCTVTCQNGIMSIQKSNNYDFYINHSFSNLINCYVSFEMRCTDNKRAEFLISANGVRVNNYDVEPESSFENGQWAKILFFIYVSNDPSSVGISFISGTDYSSSYEIRNFYIGDGSFNTPLIDNSRKYNVSNYKGYFINKTFRFDNNVIDVGKCPFDRAKYGNGLGWTISMDFGISENLSDAQRYLFSKEDSMLMAIIKSSSATSYLYGKFKTEDDTWYDFGATLDSSFFEKKYFHLVVCFSGNTLNIYQNGKLTDTYNIFAIDSDKDLFIGNYSLTGNNSPIYIRDFQVFDYKLSGSEVKALYRNIGNTPKYYTLADYENEQLSQSKADKVSNATTGHLATLDSNGNLTDSGKSSTSSVTSGSTDLVESGAVADEIQNITDIASSLPTDAVLHYSFDEVPDYPDGNADVRILDGQTYQLKYGSYAFNSNDSNATIANVNGTLECRINNSAFYLGSSYFNKIFKCKIQVTAISGTLAIHNGYQNIIERITEVGTYELTILNTNSQTYKNIYFYCNASGYSCTFKVLEVYCGDGSYSTPIIDNANGQNNATNNGGIAIQGVSGKGAYFLNGKNVNAGNFNLNDNFTVSVWVNPKNNTSGLQQNIVSKGGQFILRNGVSWGTYLMLYLYQNGSDGFTQITTSLLTPNEWHHLVISKNGTSLRCYRNGILFYIKTLSTTVVDKNDNNFSVSSTGNDRPQSVDDLLIFDRALSDTEVQALYQNKANTPKYYDLSDYKMPSKQNSELSTPITIAGQSYTTVESALQALAVQLS